MAYVSFSPQAPTGFLIIANDGARDALIQTDWDYPRVALRMGWQPCHPSTDGTIDCPECNKTTSEMIDEAYEYILDLEHEPFEALDEYL